MRRQLTGLVAASMSLVLIAFLVPMMILLERDAEHRGQLAAMARAQTVTAIAPSLTPGSLPTEAQDGLAVSVFQPDGRVLGVPAERTPAVQAAQNCRASTTEVPAGLEVLVPVPARDGCPAVVRVLATSEALTAGLLPMVLMVLSLSGALLLVGIQLAERLGRGLLRSAADLARTADQLAAGDLSARATPEGPQELRKTGTELNRLAIRVDHLVAAERRRSADLTHRLRTPLTVLRLDIDALEDKDSAQRLVEDVEAVNTAVTEVIRASRQLASDTGVRSVDLARIVRERAEFWSALAEDTERDITVNIVQEPLPVRSNRPALEATLDALLGNVFAHTQPGVDVSVTAHRVPDGGSVLVVEDAGPGFADTAMVERGRSGGSSTGLGLDIARHTAEESGGSLSLGTSADGGARVTLRFAPDC